MRNSSTNSPATDDGRERGYSFLVDLHRQEEHSSLASSTTEEGGNVEMSQNFSADQTAALPENAQSASVEGENPLALIEKAPSALTATEGTISTTEENIQSRGER